MSGCFVHGIQDQESFRRLPQLSTLEELPEALMDFPAVFRRECGHGSKESLGVVTRRIASGSASNSHLRHEAFNVNGRIRKYVTRLENQSAGAVFSA